MALYLFSNYAWCICLYISSPVRRPVVFLVVWISSIALWGCSNVFHCLSPLMSEKKQEMPYLLCKAYKVESLNVFKGKPLEARGGHELPRPSTGRWGRRRTLSKHDPDKINTSKTGVGLTSQQWWHLKWKHRWTQPALSTLVIGSFKEENTWGFQADTRGLHVHLPC